MGRTDRMLAIVLELQAHRWRRAEDLADALETSKRTIYRDLVALGRAGVPLISTPGRGYSLVEGYFLPPVSFTSDEAMILLLGADVMAQSFDAQYHAAAQSAASKITAALPERLRLDVANLRERIFIGPQSEALHPEGAATLRALRGAVISCQRVRFLYHTKSRHSDDGDGNDGGDTTARATPAQPLWREADPYTLIRLRGAWLMNGYCHLRKDRRSFRLERIESLTVLDEHFTPPTGATLRPRRLSESERPIEARIQFDAEAARWARESPSFFTTAQEETPDGGLLVTLRIRHENDITQWLLGWGKRARVLAPASLRQLIAAEAAALLALYPPD